MFKAFSHESLCYTLDRKCSDPRTFICTNLKHLVLLIFQTHHNCLLVVLQKKIFKGFFTLRPILKLWPHGPRGPPFEQTWIPTYQGSSMQSLAWIGPMVSEEKIKMWIEADGQWTTDGWQTLVDNNNSQGPLCWSFALKCHGFIHHILSFLLQF